jgi:glutaredoxin
LTRPARPRRAHVLVLAPLLLVFLSLLSCKRAPKPQPVEEPASAAPEVKDSTEGLVFSWIDDKGEFHVVEKTSDVPIAGRDAVRVMDPAHYDTDHPDRVYVADLRVAGPDGSYPVRIATREELDAIALARRSKAGPTLASASHPTSSGEAPPGSPTSAAQGIAQAPSGTARPAVIIYGASWCGACHQAAAYLKQKGVPFVEKDVEADATAAREMQSKLAHAGKRGGSIPVIDVRGKLMVGFNPQEIDRALGTAL